MHVVQVLAPLADEGVVVDDLEASEARAMSMPSDDDTESVFSDLFSKSAFALLGLAGVSE